MPTLLAGRFSSSMSAALVGAVFKYRTLLASVLVFFFCTAAFWQGSAVHSGLWFSALIYFGFSSVRIARQHRYVSGVWEPVAMDKARTYINYAGPYL
jgi:hypothetical protein